MTSPMAKNDHDHNEGCLSLDEGIALIESGSATLPVCIDFGADTICCAQTSFELDSLLQRARGLRMITLMAEGKQIERPAHMRSVKPALHPLVKEILDALGRSN